MQHNYVTIMMILMGETTQVQRITKAKVAKETQVLVRLTIALATTQIVPIV